MNTHSLLALACFAVLALSCKSSDSPSKESHAPPEGAHQESHGKSDPGGAGGDHDHKAHDHKADEHKAHDHKADEHKAHAQGGETLRLNKGEKWIANRETTEGVLAMRALVEKGLAEAEATPGESKLGEELRTTYQEIFNKCTMTGDAHQNLHHFLVPVGDLLAKLEKPEDAAAQTSTLKELAARLELYETFFH